MACWNRDFPAKDRSGLPFGINQIHFCVGLVYFSAGLVLFLTRSDLLLNKSGLNFGEDWFTFEQNGSRKASQKRVRIPDPEPDTWI